MKEGSWFVCTNEIHQTGDASDHLRGVVGKLSRRRGASALSFMVFWTCGAKVS